VERDSIHVHGRVFGDKPFKVEPFVHSRPKELIYASEGDAGDYLVAGYFSSI
jgi:hypothetical protein